MQEFTWPLNTTTYGYDQAGDLTSISRPKAGENPAIEETLAYDATGLLTAKTIGAATKHLAWDESTNLPLLLNDGENSYVYGPGGLPIEQISSKEEPTYLHHDQLGSTRLLTGSGGTTSATASYSPYGAPEATTGTATTPLGFAGQYTDAETGLQYLRARFYDPGTGQFLSRDPLAAVTREPYDYAAGNPLLFKDPSGLDFIEEAESGGIPCLFCVAQETLEPVAEEIEAAAGDAAWVLSHSLGSEELDEGEYEDSESCAEAADEYRREIPPREETDRKDRQFLDKLGHSGSSNPSDPGWPPSGSRLARVATVLGKLLGQFHRGP